MAIKTDKSTTDDELDFLEGGSTGSNPEMPDFTSGGSIFGTPGGLLGSTTIGADGGTPGGFLTGAAPTFGVPGAVPGMTLGDIGMFAPSGTMMGNTFLNSPSGLGPSGIDFGAKQGDWWNNTTTAADVDMSGVALGSAPFRNISIATGTPSTTGGVTTLTETSNVGGNVTTDATGDVVKLDPFKVGAGGQGPDFLAPGYISTPVTGGNALLGSVSTGAVTDDSVKLDPVYVEATKSKPGNISVSVTPTTGATGGTVGSDTTDTSGATVLDKYVVSDKRVDPNLGTFDWDKYQQNLFDVWNKNNPIVLPEVKVGPSAEDDKKETGGFRISQTGTANTDPWLGLDDIKKTGYVPDTSKTDKTDSNTGILPSGTLPSGTTQTGSTGTGTTSTSSAMNQRDLEAELGKSLAALQKYQPQMLGMYKDIYNQFMPESLSAASRSALGQLQADEAKLARLRAGQLSPEDVRQSQQAAREAYGARGQAMGTGAIGAEILNRENIRQQREDQARAAYQQSMGNLFNTANLQTGNIFNPIASLISGSFNPLGAYPADVYGTNVNAQLARDIAQKNYEAAVRSAELQGSAAKSAANTSIFGDFLKVGTELKLVFKCLPGDQAIDTPNGSKAIQDIRGGDEVIGYDGLPHRVLQVCSYIENPETEFLTFTLENGHSITTCDKHRILDIPAMEWVVGAKMNGLEIKSIDKKVGITTSYDLVTEVGGYRIAGVPVNSMIPEMLAMTMQLVALKHA